MQIAELLMTSAHGEGVGGMVAVLVGASNERGWAREPAPVALYANASIMSKMESTNVKIRVFDMALLLCRRTPTYDRTNPRTISAIPTTPDPAAT